MTTRDAPDCPFCASASANREPRDGRLWFCRCCARAFAVDESGRPMALSAPAQPVRRDANGVIIDRED